MVFPAVALDGDRDFEIVTLANEKEEVAIAIKSFWDLAVVAARTLPVDNEPRLLEGNLEILF